MQCDQRQLWVGMRRPPDQSRTPEAVIEATRESPVRHRPAAGVQAAARICRVNFGIKTDRSRSRVLVQHALQLIDSWYLQGADRISSTLAPLERKANPERDRRADTSGSQYIGRPVRPEHQTRDGHAGDPRERRGQRRRARSGQQAAHGKRSGRSEGGHHESVAAGKARAPIPLAFPKRGPRAADEHLQRIDGRPRWSGPPVERMHVVTEGQYQVGDANYIESCIRSLLRVGSDTRILL